MVIQGLDPTTGTGAIRPPDGGGPLDDVELALLDAYWRAANYLSVGQIYLMTRCSPNRTALSTSSRDSGHDQRSGPKAHLRQEMVDARSRARAYTREHGEDPPEIAGWTWPA